MTGVTYSSKRYISVCPGCDRLFDTERRDAMTCSPACRVRAHRSGELKRLRSIAKSLKVRPAGILHAPSTGSAPTCTRASWRMTTSTSCRTWSTRST
jgi:hypothetical protein